MFQTGQLSDDLFQIVLVDVQFQTDFTFCREDSLQHHGKFFDLLLFERILHGFLVCDETGGADAEGINNFQAVRAQAGTGFRNLDDGIGEAGRFDFRCAPGEFHLRIDAVFFQIAFRHADCFRGDAFAFQIGCTLDVGIFRHGEDPAERVSADFPVNQFGGFHHIGPVFLDPVKAGETAVQDSFFDVLGHFLSADQHTFDFRVVNRGIIGPGADFDFVARLGEHGGRRCFEASFRNTEHEFIAHVLFSLI